MDFLSELPGIIWQGVWDAAWRWLDPPGPAPQDHSGDPEVENDFKKLLARNPKFSDPVYKQNLQRLIERNREFEEKKE